MFKCQVGDGVGRVLTDFICHKLCMTHKLNTKGTIISCLGQLVFPWIVVCFKVWFVGLLG